MVAIFVEQADLIGYCFEKHLHVRNAFIGRMVVLSRMPEGNDPEGGPTGTRFRSRGTDGMSVIGRVARGSLGRVAGPRQDGDGMNLSSWPGASTGCAAPMVAPAKATSQASRR